MIASQAPHLGLDAATSWASAPTVAVGFFRFYSFRSWPPPIPAPFDLAASSSSAATCFMTSPRDYPPFVRLMSLSYLPQRPRHLPAYPSRRCFRVNVYSITNTSLDLDIESSSDVGEVRTFDE
jgi:hypothetical protein